MADHCLAFDPGATVGFAILESAPGTRRPRFIDGGSERFDDPSFFASLLDAFRHQYPYGRIAIESDPPGHSKKAHKIRKGGRDVDISGALQDMMRVAGIIEGIAIGVGLDVDHVPATVWRRSVCGKPTASDAEVKRMVTMLVEGLPARSSAHLRDAVGCAYVALSMRRAAKGAA